MNQSSNIMGNGSAPDKPVTEPTKEDLAHPVVTPPAVSAPTPPATPTPSQPTP